MKPTGATKEASIIDWQVLLLPIHGYAIIDANGGEIVRDVYRKEDAEQIVREHNAVVFAVKHGHGWELSDWRNWRHHHARAALNGEQG